MPWASKSVRSRVGQVADVACKDLVAADDLREAVEPDVGEAHLLQDRVRELGLDPGSDPFGTLARDDAPVGGDAVLEEVRPARADRVAELLEHVRSSLAPGRLEQQTLGAAAHGLEDRVAPAQVALDPLALDACRRAREDHRELVGDLAERASLEARPAPRPRCVEAEHAGERSLPPQRHVEEGADAAGRQRGDETLKPPLGAHVLDGDRLTLPQQPEVLVVDIGRLDGGRRQVRVQRRVLRLQPVLRRDRRRS